MGMTGENEVRLQARLGVEWSQEPRELGGEYSCGGRPEGVIRVRRSRRGAGWCLQVTSWTGRSETSLLCPQEVT